MLQITYFASFIQTYVKVCKKNGDGTFFAMKEILLTNPNLGKTTSERNKSSGNIIQETKFLKEQVSILYLFKFLIKICRKYEMLCRKIDVMFKTRTSRQ